MVCTDKESDAEQELLVLINDRHKEPDQTHAAQVAAGKTSQIISIRLLQQS